MSVDSDTAGGRMLHGRRVMLRPLAAGEVQRIATRIADDENASPWWGTDSAKVERWLVERDTIAYAIDIGGELAGVIAFEEENDPDYRFAGIDMALLTPWLGAGYGPEALYVLCRHLFEQRGHHRLHIDPAASNERAIRAYAKVGFRPVGIMRKYERGPDGVWRDGLLMDLLAEELTDPYPVG